MKLKIKVGEMETTCPHCKYKITNHETLDGQKNPAEGDISVCINCCDVSEFKEGELVKIKLSRIPTLTRIQIGQLQDAWLQTRHMVKKNEELF